MNDLNELKSFRSVNLCHHNQTKLWIDLLSFSSFTVWIGLILILLSSRTMEASLDKCLEKCRLKQRVL